MSAGPAMRTVSAQVCRQCRKEQLQNTSKYTSRRRFSSSPAPLASTSTATPATNFMNRLRFEVGQANPSLASTWRSLNAVHNEEPAKLSPDLVRQTIPILQKHKKPSRTFPRTSRGPQYRAELVEEAEAVYMRYRFVASRLKETGSEPQSVTQILYWLQALKALSYAPAAWRIWKDALEQARRDGIPVAKQISTLVLVATAKWLFLLVEHTPSPAGIAEVIYFLSPVKQTLNDRCPPQARKEADAVLAYLEANGQVDGTIASLNVRIIKHSSRYPDFVKAVKATFGLDLDMPCAPPGLVSDGVVRPMDKHSHNSILGALAGRKQFSKMVSIYESLAYPPIVAIPQPVQVARWNSFFSFSFGWFRWRDRAGTMPAETVDTANSREEAISEPAEASVVSTTEAEQPQGNLEGPEVGYPPVLKINALNTRTFELMIENALEGSGHGVARHYMLEMLEAWEQERQRLRKAYAELAAYRVPFVSAGARSRTGMKRTSPILQDPNRPAWDRIWQTNIEGPAIGPSVHSIYRIYHKLAGSWTSRLDWLKPLKELVTDVNRVLEHVREDLNFWTHIHDKQRLLAEAFASLPRDQRVVHSSLPKSIIGDDVAGRDEDGLSSGYQNLPFDSQLHLLILRKVEAEMSDIYQEMHHRHTHTAAGRYIRGMLNELKGERKTSRISRLVNAIRRSEAWCRADELAEEQRIEAILALNTLSRNQKGNQVRNMKRIAHGRRQAVRRAILRARGTLAELQRSPEEAEPIIEAAVEATKRRRLSSQLQDVRKTRSSDPQGNLATLQTAPELEASEGDAISAPKLTPRRIRVQLGEKEILPSTDSSASASGL